MYRLKPYDNKLMHLYYQRDPDTPMCNGRDGGKYGERDGGESGRSEEGGEGRWETGESSLRLQGYNAMKYTKFYFIMCYHEKFVL